jgi:hypothetical protein
METIQQYKDTKVVCKINKYINSLNLKGNKRQLEHIKFVDIYLNENRIPFRILFIYDNDEFNNPNSFKGSQLPHRLLIFDKSPISIPESDKTLNKDVILRKNKFTGEILILEFVN